MTSRPHIRTTISSEDLLAEELADLHEADSLRQATQRQNKQRTSSEQNLGGSLLFPGTQTPSSGRRLQPDFDFDDPDAQIDEDAFAEFLAHNEANGNFHPSSSQDLSMPDSLFSVPEVSDSLLSPSDGITPRWTTLRHHAIQASLWASTSRFCVVPAGRRSGKTELGKRKLVRCAIAALLYPDEWYVAAAPTLPQAKRIYWRDLKSLIPSSLMAGRPKESEYTIQLVNGAEITVMGMDTPERIEGRPLSGIVLDEYANMKPQVWTAHVRPALADRQGWCWFIGVPEGRNHYYKLYRKALQAMAPSDDDFVSTDRAPNDRTRTSVLVSGTKTPSPTVSTANSAAPPASSPSPASLQGGPSGIRADSPPGVASNVDESPASLVPAPSQESTGPEWAAYTWMSEDILPASEIKSAKEDLDPLTYAQEFCAAFVSFEGRVYYAFDENLHAAESLQHYYDPYAPLNLCFDFNVAPGVAVICQEHLYTGTNQAVPRLLDASGKPMLLRTVDIETRPELVARRSELPLITMVLDEIYIPRNSNTEKICEEIVKVWGRHQGAVHCYGDATGGAKGTAKVKGSDWALVKNGLAPTFGGRLSFRVKKSNPKERERVNAVNSRFLNCNRQVRCLLDKHKTPHLQEDYSGVMCTADGSGAIDKESAPNLTHISDAHGYYIEHQYPVGPKPVTRIGEA